MTTPDYTNNTGTGISFDIPVTLPSALGAVSAAIATGVADAGSPDPISVRRRWATIVAINADSTVDINLGGTLVPHVSYDASYHPALDEVVQVNVVDTDITVIGPTAQATYVGFIRRSGTIATVNRSDTAPGAPTSVNVTLDDANPPVSILNVPFVSEYFPTVGDDVVLGQGTNTDVYLVLGAVNRTFRRPTGDIEPSLMPVAKPNTLICQGQALSRTTYAALWAWAQLNGLSGPSTTLTTDFEDGGTLFVGPNWTQANTTDRAASGTRSLLLTRANTTSQSGYVSQTRTVTVGQTYHWSFSAYAPTSTAYSFIIQLNHSNGTTNFRIYDATFLPPAATWTRYSAVFSVPVGYISASIFITDDPNTTPTSGSTLNIDDVSLYTNNGHLFTTGNGTTTFTLPDFRGRFPVGAGALGPDTYALGQIGGHRGLSGLSPTHLPRHDHNVSGTVGTGGGHNHTGGTDNGASTGASHQHASSYTFSGVADAHAHAGMVGRVSEGKAGGDLGDLIYTTVNGLHTHGFTTNPAAAHGHALTLDAVPSGGPSFSDLRPSFLAVNWLIWT